MEKQTKESLIKKLTKAASEVTSIPEAHFTFLIKENELENWGIGGEPLEKVIQKMKS